MSPPPSTANTTPREITPREITPPREAVVLQSGAQRVEIIFVRGPAGSDRVASIRVDQGSVFPADCTTGKTGMCSRAHRTLLGEADGDTTSDVYGKGAHIVLLDSIERPDAAYALFASTIFGSPECGTYAFWILRVDAKGPRVTEPIMGCFHGAGSREDPGGPMPIVAWTDPPLLWVESPYYQPGSAVVVYVLEEDTMTLSPRIRTKARQ